MSWLKFEEPKREGGVILALVGESGSGKTYSALRVARGFAGAEPFAVLDTEEGRAGHYKHIGAPWKHAKFPAPWSSARYVEALTQIEESGFSVAVIDQASSEWESEGGVLDAADSGVSRYNKPLEGAVKWMEPKRQHRKFREKLIHSRCKLLIVLLREKRVIDWDHIDPNGKKSPKFLGMFPIQDPRFAYDATVQLRLLADGRYEWQKKVTQELRDCFPESGQLTEETGRKLRAWADESAPREIRPEAPDSELLEQGTEAASRGIEALQGWWSDLTPDMKREVKPEMARLKALARGEVQP
jgi:hypothetical protein